MAAEASRSSGAATDSYIGSLISLTSKSDFRYEGVLFTINTEEASIGLRDVRSFGTEGRKKDGPQVPPIDKVYEYIVFRGSDIKDLQVKSSPQPQSGSIHNDPATVQSQYSQAPASTGLPHVSNAAVLDVSTQTSQSGVPRSPFQSTPPLHQPGGGSISSWSSSAIPPTSGPLMPMYQQGLYGASSNIQSQQPPMLQPPQNLARQSVSGPDMYQQGFYGISSDLRSQPPMLQPPQNFSGQLVSGPADASLNMLPSKTLPQVPLPVSQSLGQPLVSPVSNALDVKDFNAFPNQMKPALNPMASYTGMPEPLSTAAGSSIAPMLLTPGQFSQPGSASLAVSQPTQTMQKNVEAVQLSSSVQLHPPAVSVSVSVSEVLPISTEAQATHHPIPPPPPAIREVHSFPMYNQNIHGGHHGRGRGSELLYAATRFTEDFDFEAMNEKFNKNEVWGHLGKAKVDDNQDSHYVDNVAELPQFEAKPVYNKDDFFDSLSSNFHGNNSRNNWRPRFSEQRRFDTNEPYGEFSSYRGGQGQYGPGYGQFNRGGYYGRGYGNAGRGRGQYNVYRAM